MCRNMRDKYINYKKETVKVIGQTCREYRERVLRVSQNDIALSLGLTSASISQFEMGLIDSIPILMEYINRGMKI